MPRVLTDPYIKNLKAADVGKRYAVADALVPGLKVRVTERGTKTFTVWRRFGGAKNPTARAIGEVGVISLSEAREKAREWVLLAKRGEDPAEIERGRRAKEAKEKSHTFEAVAEAYIAQHISKRRRAKHSEAEFRRLLISRWGDRPITKITLDDVIEMAEGLVAEGKAPTAYIAFGHARCFFNWVKARRNKYGVLVSPCENFDAAKIVGPKVIRQRTLSDGELCALWHAAETVGYPGGTLVQMLMLTGQRPGEVTGARWQEIDLQKQTWTIPPERYKTDCTHLVPLSGDVMELLTRLPRWNNDLLFSATGGEKPLNSFSKLRKRLSAEMQGRLVTKIPHWVFHDIRRTVRTKLSALRVPSDVAERVIGHGPRGIIRVYDTYSFDTEKREALAKWANELAAITHDRPWTDNIVELKSA